MSIIVGSQLCIPHNSASRGIPPGSKLVAAPPESRNSLNTEQDVWSFLVIDSSRNSSWPVPGRTSHQQPCSDRVLHDTKTSARSFLASETGRKAALWFWICFSCRQVLEGHNKPADTGQLALFVRPRVLLHNFLKICHVAVSNSYTT